MRPVLLVLLCGCLGSFGCSSDHEAMEKRLASLRDDITHLQAENDRLNERVDGLESKSAVAEKPISAAPVARQEHPALRVVKLEPGDALALSEPADLPADERADAPGNRPVIRLRGGKDGGDSHASGGGVRPSAEDKP
jgi:hypothetical protein